MQNLTPHPATRKVGQSTEIVKLLRIQASDTHVVEFDNVDTRFNDCNNWQVILLRNKLRHALAFLFDRLNVWCNGIEMKGLLAWFPADVESVPIIPFLPNSDRHSIFRVNNPERKGELTQFTRAIKTLGIEPIHANSPQAIGRVERANQTLQDRLVKEMRLQGISDIETANAWLSTFI